MSTEGANQWRQERRLEQEQKAKQLQSALESASTPEDRAAAAAAIYGPSAFKQHAENLFGRLVGRAPQPVVPPYAAPSVTTPASSTPMPQDPGLGDSGGTVAGQPAPTKAAPGIGDDSQLPALPAPSFQNPPVTVQGPAPHSRAEALAGVMARGTTANQRALALAQGQQNLERGQAGWQAEFNRQQAGPDLETKVRAVNSSLDAAGITDTATRQRALANALGVKRPTVYEQKMEDYNTALQNGYKGSPEQWLAEEGAKGRVAGGPIKPQATKIMMVGNKPMIMEFNPENRKFDHAIGEAPPTYASIAVELAKTRAYYGAMYGVTQVTDSNGEAVYIPRLEAVKAFTQGNPYMVAAYGSPTGTEKTRQDFAASAQFIIPRMKEIVASHPEVFGPAAGRATTLQAWLGSQSPDAQRFLTGATILGEHSAAVFGSRAQKVAEQIQNAATDPKINPEALTAGLDELNGIAGEFTNPNNRLPSTAGSGRPAPKKPSENAPKKIKIGDKFYTYNGSGDTADLKNYTEVKK